jgi:hypothetical protein
MRDNFSCLANSILKYLVKQRERQSINDSMTLYNGWACGEKRSYGYTKPERMIQALTIIESLNKNTDKELNILLELERRDGALDDYCEVSN